MLPRKFSVASSAPSVSGDAIVIGCRSVDRSGLAKSARPGEVR